MRWLSFVMRGFSFVMRNLDLLMAKYRCLQIIAASPTYRNEHDLKKITGIWERILRRENKPIETIPFVPDYSINVKPVTHPPIITHDEFVKYLNRCYYRH